MEIQYGMYTSGFWYYGIYHGVLCSHHDFHDFFIWSHIILAEQLEGIFDFNFDSFLLFIINHFFISGLFVFWRFSIPTHGDTGVLRYFVDHSFFFFLLWFPLSISSLHRRLK